MKEIYRSFEGKLDVDNQDGYIVYEGKGFFEIHSISVWSDKKDWKCRIKKEMNWKDWDAVCEECYFVENGSADGQAFYNGKWYGSELIRKIMNDHQDYCWQKYVK